jgi:hypothetical protein
LRPLFEAGAPLSAIIQSQVQLGIAQHNAQNDLAVVTKQIPQQKPPEPLVK